MADGDEDITPDDDKVLAGLLGDKPGAASSPAGSASDKEGADEGVIQEGDDAAPLTDEDEGGDGTADDQSGSGQPDSPRVIEEADLEAAKQEGFREAAKFLTQQLADIRTRNGETPTPPKEEKDPVIALAEVPFAEIQREQKRLLDAGQNIEAEMLVADYRSARMVATERKRSSALEARLAALEAGTAQSATDGLKARLDGVTGGKREKWEPLQDTIGELILMDKFRESQGLVPKYGGDAAKLYRAAAALHAAETGKGFAPSIDAGKKAALGNLPGRTSGRGPAPAGGKAKVSKEEALMNQMVSEFKSTF